MLSEEEQQSILNLPAYPLQVQARRDLVPPGAKVDHVCLVASGLIGRFGQTTAGERQITAIHVPGDVADLHSVVQPASVSALQALSAATVLRIPHVSVRAAAASYPAVAEALWRDCMVDAAVLSQWVVNVGRRQATERLAHLICEMAVRICGAQPSEDTVFDLRITQGQLADATGMTSVHVNRTLQKLRREGILDWPRGSMVRIPRWDHLAAIGDFDEAYLQRNARPEERLRIARAS